MSKIVNPTTDYVVQAVDYSQYLAQDIYQRSQIESGQLPVIYRGLQVTAAGGLAVTVSAGSARGQDITILDITPNQPSFVELPTNTNVDIPASTTGYIVLKTNIEEVAGDVERQTWDVDISSVDTENDLLPVFVTSIPTANISSYPYSVIVLAYVVTDGSSVTSINMRPYLGNRSFDYNFFQNPIIVSGQPANSVNYILQSNGIVTFGGVTSLIGGGGSLTVNYPFTLSSVLWAGGTVEGGDASWEGNPGLSSISFQNGGNTIAVNWQVTGIAAA